MKYFVTIIVFVAGFFVATPNSTLADDERFIAITVRDSRGDVMPRTIITLISDDTIAGVSLPEHTVFTDAFGRATVEVPAGERIYLRARKPSYYDSEVDVANAQAEIALTLEKITDLADLAENIPASAWLAALDFGNAKDKEHFTLQCAFCHQQGSPIIRMDRTEEEWAKIIDRMLRYGSRLKTPLQKTLPELIRREHARLRDNPSLIPAVRPWGQEVVGAHITEWKLGDGSSQLHDVFLASTGLIYVGDNLQDNLIVLDPKTGKTQTYKIPKQEGDMLGGNTGGRLKNYPGVGAYVGLHSLDESPTDGHLFLTGSDSSRLVEFAPESGTFTLYDLPEGFYPHTIRVDSEDRVWFTMAVSNQVAVFDRKSAKFTFYDLPTRSFKEKMTIAALPLIMKLANMGMDTHDMAVDETSQGLPLPYGIDLAPDDSVWFTRLHANEIGHIEPDTGKITMYKTPFIGPRRLRTDAEGKVWVTVFASGRLAKFDPDTEKFTLYDLPTEPLGSDTPYSLAVDRERNQIWVNGTASDTMLRYDITSEKWAVFPMPRMRTFTRDVAIAKDGSIYTSNGSFPAWHIEDGQPTVIHIVPNDRAVKSMQEMVK